MELYRVKDAIIGMLTGPSSRHESMCSVTQIHIDDLVQLSSLRIIVELRGKVVEVLQLSIDKLFRFGDDLLRPWTSSLSKLSCFGLFHSASDFISERSFGRLELLFQDSSFSRIVAIVSS